MALCNALIRTHHITSRKKVAHLKKAASKYGCYALIRSGGSPGIMYCEGTDINVRSWVATVQNLRYKDYQLIAKPDALNARISKELASRPSTTGLHEVETVKTFGEMMKQFGLLEWWRRSMGYVNE